MTNLLAIARRGVHRSAIAVVLPSLFLAAAAVPLAAQTNWQQFGSFLPQPGGRSVFGLTYDAHRKVTILFGGQLFGGFYTNETWQFNGNDWLQLTPSSSPQGVRTNMLAYDAVRRRVVLFGGGNSFGYSDLTSEFDGITWTQRSPVHRPPARDGGAFAYDSIRRRIVLFGGWNGTRMSDTWEWDGSDWTQRILSGPAGRSDHNMAYDEGRGVMVMHGGYNDVNRFLGDTWEYDGNAWTLVTPAINPGPLADSGITYDRGRGRIVLFGGSSSFLVPHTNQTWEYDGSTWTDLTGTLANSPSGRWVVNLTYDEARARVVMFGGIDNFNQFPNDTWELATQNVARQINFGIGCAGSVGEPQLLVDHNAMPRIASVWGLRAQNLPLAPNTQVLLAIGFSNVFSGSSPLPLNLAPIGMPGCNQYVSLDLTIGGAAAGGIANFAIGVPNTPTLIGQHVYAQAFVVDPGANAAGLTATAGTDGTIGN